MTSSRPVKGQRIQALSLSADASASASAWLLDTNILSEMVRPLPDPVVMAALHGAEGRMAVPVTVLQELLFGWLRMPESRAKRHIERFLKETVALMPLLPVDAAAARHQAALRLDAERRGRPISFADSQIAGIALAHDLTLATRNLRDFHDRPGLRCVNWFDPVNRSANRTPG